MPYIITTKTGESVSRRAVATLEEIPKGVVFTVEPCDRFWLLSEMGDAEHDPRTTAEVIDAFNAE